MNKIQILPVDMLACVVYIVCPIDLSLGHSPPRQYPAIWYQVSKHNAPNLKYWIQNILYFFTIILVFCHKICVKINVIAVTISGFIQKPLGKNKQPNQKNENSY